MNRSAAARVLTMLVLAPVALAACETPTPRAPVAAAPTTAGPSVEAGTAARRLMGRPSPTAPVISRAGLAYFFAVAFGSQYGDTYSVVTKWTEPTVTVRVHGGDAKSLSCLNTVVSDLNKLTATTDLKLTKSDADIEMHFAPLSEFKKIEPHYVAGNDSYAYIFWSDLHAITSATVLVRSTGISPTVRCHLIRQALTRGMGLLKDSTMYPSSIFYNSYSPAVTKYDAIDEEVIRLLYDDALSPGDDKRAVTAAVTIR
ncbi:DUF2927 domain-containing protein [Actinoplanes sp. HUAS TT8]|uniref:DUF2927 domain-containing protein n=1 Tax=Actinoplanes sp. HUAS TT8 TaxID=3447453 RepID=UPI003F520476